MHFVSDCQEPEHVRHCVLMVQAELKKGSEYLLNTLLLRYSFALNLILCKQANMHDQIRFILQMNTVKCSDFKFGIKYN